MEIKYLEVLVMPNTEILCEGKTVGFTDKLGKYLKDGVFLNKEEAKMVKAALAAWEGEARSDEPHWTYTVEYKDFLKRLREFISK